MSGSVWIHRPGHPLANARGMVEIRFVPAEEAELAVAGPKRLNVVGDTHHDGIRSPVDGSTIDTKVKRREHMRRHDLADYDDFQGKWQTEDARRTAMRTGHFDNKERTEAIDKAWWQVTEKKYKPSRERAEVTEMVGVAAAVKDEDLLKDRGVVKLKEHE